MLDENKWLAARHGLEGELVDLPERRARRRRKELARRLYDRLREHAQDLGSAAELEGDRRPARARQRRRTGSAWSTRRTTTSARSCARSSTATAPVDVTAGLRRVDSDVAWRAAPTSSSSARSCGSEVSPYITECPYCGTRLRKRAPKLERGGVPQGAEGARAAGRTLRRLQPGEIPGIRADRRPYATIALVLASILGLAGRPHQAGPAGRVDLVARRRRDRRVLARGHHAVRLRHDRLRGRRARRDRPVRLAARAPPRRVGAAAACSSSAARAASCARRRGRRRRHRARRQRRRARRCSPRGRCATCSAAAAASEDDGDLLGVLAIAAVLVLLPLATEEASALAGLGGGVIGVILGAVLARLRER